MKPVVLILASGKGVRFNTSGGVGSKLDAQLNGRSVLCRTLDAVKATGMPWHVEDRGHAGMGDSISAAVSATRDALGWLVLPGDLPLIRPDTLLSVAAALPGHSVVLPSYQGRRGHPVAFASECRQALLQLQGAQGASAVVKSMQATGSVLNLSLDDPGLIFDIDTLQDLRRVQRLLDRQ